MAFAQLTYPESLCDIASCLGSVGSKLYYMGFRSKVARSTLADANHSRDWRIFADFTQILISIARPLYVNDDIAFDLDQTLYALDSTTIDLCLSLFPWAKFRKTKRLPSKSIPCWICANTFIQITEGKVSDVRILDEVLPEAGAFYVMDRGYLDFERLRLFDLCSAFFVIRTKRKVLLNRRDSRPIDKTTGLRSDQTALLATAESAKAYPDPLRQISYRDQHTECFTPATWQAAPNWLS